ncbi:hypothetical protein PEPNEM18_01305 [Aedoeadaptatus nemausensis]|uniref:YfjL-like N-terminal domain-containing protein n=1 Tax=Aedoeadaptatus nemausensis TaxID=2582829 RepID=A0A6V6Y5X1_9FIRM|nr:hypothetical protein [Peptoniphilus nemausensis]CAC9933874.1 hypothetical protein PEPNEM18_01305 [Peptoniphilus nemausensis]
MKLTFKKVLLAVLVLFVLFVANTFFGNPVSKFLAERGADRVIAAKYEDLDLFREKVIYNLKDGDYIVFLEDKNSVDSQFALHFDSFGRLTWDSYDDRISNTVMRFDRIVSQYGRSLEKKYDFPYTITLSSWDKEDPAEYLKVDQPVDVKHLPYKLQAQAYGVGKDATAEEAMAVLKGLQEIMDEEGLDVVDYAIDLVPEKNRGKEDEVETWEDMYSAYEVPADVVRRGDVKALEDLVKLQTTTGKE